MNIELGVLENKDKITFLRQLKTFMCIWIGESICMDYFRENKYAIDDDLHGIRKDVAMIINEDIEKYREYSVVRYNNDEDRATDKFCFKEFLNEYNVAINVFGLHSEFGKSPFNKFITSSFQGLLYDKF